MYERNRLSPNQAVALNVLEVLRLDSREEYSSAAEDGQAGRVVQEVAVVA